MPYLARLLCWLIATCCFDDGAVPEFQADLISSGQSIPCKLEDIRVGKAIVLEVRQARSGSSDPGKKRPAFACCPPKTHVGQTSGPDHTRFGPPCLGQIHSR
jgi:hypothetical protein